MPIKSPNSPVRIIVGGDISPTALDEAFFTDSQPSRLLDGHVELWREADFTLLNLECPLTRSESRIEKIGPHLKASPDCARFFRKLPVSALCLANNHIRDYGDEGVSDTLRCCAAVGIPTVGAGSTLSEAREPFRSFVRGLRLGVMAMAEEEFNLARVNRPGANPIDYRNFSLLAQLSQSTDFCLVLVHGGTERLQFPRPGLVELCRFLVDQGADAVIVQHTHCVGCYEVYREAPIVYGQGNCIFGSLANRIEFEDPNWFVGMLVELRVSARRGCKMLFHPFEQSRGFPGLRPLAGESREAFMSGLEERSRLLADPLAQRERWREFCRSHRGEVLARSYGLSGILASVNDRLPFSRLADRLTNANLRRNLVACESHRELLADCLGLTP
jgi:poly-gamma-glutamate synthesis protein (capsule biosynthesis protein)